MLKNPLGVSLPDADLDDVAGSRTVARVIGLLELLTESPQPLRLSDVSRQLKLPVASAHSLLQRLMKLNYIEAPDNERRFRIGPRLLRLAVRVVDRVSVERLARPVLEQLAFDCKDDVYLAIPQHDGICHVAKFEGAEGFCLNIRLGTLRPLHSTSVGKLYLALSSREQRQRLVGAGELASFTPDTIVDRMVLDDALAAIVEQGYAVNVNETVEGVCSIAFPIFDIRGAFVAALSIWAPWRRFVARREEFARMGAAAAREIGLRIGAGAS